MLFQELEISSKVYYLIKIIIILLIILIIYKYFFGSELENFNLEGSENIDSLYNINNFVVGDLVVTQSFNMIPKGSVVAWTKDKIPKGWAICDGTNGTPDLRGRFIVGSGQGKNLSNRNVGDNGGEENHVLQANEIPSHGHSMTIYGGFNVMRKISLDGPNCAWVLLDGSLPYAKTSNPIDDKQNEIQTQGHNNMPPFFILYYIMKL